MYLFLVDPINIKIISTLVVFGLLKKVRFLKFFIQQKRKGWSHIRSFLYFFLIALFGYFFTYLLMNIIQFPETNLSIIDQINTDFGESISDSDLDKKYNHYIEKTSHTVSGLITLICFVIAIWSQIVMISKDERKLDLS